MIEPGYCLTMARYNAWQNKQMKTVLDQMSDDELRRDRGAFFGSIFATVNHLLWGDQLWISRFDGGAAPKQDIPSSTQMTPTLAVWGSERFRTDGRILLWAEKVKKLDLTGDLSWYSGAMQRDFRRPVAQCVMQLFNHQTHHRGQVHAMVTAAGYQGWTTDVPFMPEDGPWL